MPWGPVIDSEILAIHAALVATPAGGEVLYFGGDQHFRDNNLGHLQDPSKVDATRRFACRPDGAGVHRITKVTSPTDDVFCAGHAFFPDGRLLVCGGTELFPADAAGGHGHGEAGHFPGHRQCWIYDPRTQRFERTGALNPNSDGVGGGRWYPTLVTLPSGELFVYAGHPSNADPKHNAGAAERFRPESGTWVRLPPTAGAQQGQPDLYPRMFVIPGGDVLVVSALFGYDRCVEMNPCTGSVTETVALPLPHYRGFNASAVLLPLLPGDGYRARILVCGGETPQRLNLREAGGTPQWRTAGQRHGSAAGKVREHACAVLLPTGQVLLTGGVEPPVDQTPERGVNQPEIYTAAIDWTSGRYRDVADPGDSSDRWDTVEQASPVVRNYHSTALLMPDGRVWTAGSSIRAQAGNPAQAGQLKISVFTPPYPAGTRPQLTGAPRAVGYGQRFRIDTPNAGTIGRVALLRCGSVTHAFDADQRYVGLTFTVAGPSALDAVSPPSADLAPPGEYMLFVVDTDGRPCVEASFVLLGTPAQRPVPREIGELVAKLTLPDSSNRSPSIASDEARVFLAWKGADNPQLNVMLSMDDAATFVGKHTAADTSGDAPSLAVCRGDAFIAWTGEGDGNLNVALVEHTDTPTPRVTGLGRKVVLTETSDHRPSLAADRDGNMFLAWTGQGGGNLNLVVSSDTGATWGGKFTFPDTSDHAPAIVAHECGSVFLAWRGSGNENLNVARVQLTGSPTAPRVVGLINKVVFPDTSVHPPALASQESRLYLGWTGEGAANLNLATPVDSASGHKKRVYESESSDDGPALTHHGTELFLAWRGSGNENLNVAKLARPGRRLDAFTTGPDSFTVPAGSIVTRAQAGSMLGGTRLTRVYNTFSPNGASTRLDIGADSRLEMTLGLDQHNRLEVIYGLKPDGTVSDLRLNLHEGGANRIRTTISHLTSGGVNFNVVVFTPAGWSIAGRNTGPGRIELPFTAFDGPGGQDFTHVRCIVFIFQLAGGMTVESIETLG